MSAQAAALRRLVDAVECDRLGVWLDTANSSGCGEGLVKVPALLETLTAAGRDVNCILELWSELEATVEAALRKGRQRCGTEFTVLKSSYRFRLRIVEGCK